MRTFQTIHLRCFHVLVKDERTGETIEDTIIFTKGQLRAAQIVGQSSKELIHRTYNREGFAVLAVGKATKAEVELDLEDLFNEAVGE